MAEHDVRLAGRHMENQVTYIPNPTTTVGDGTITIAKLGGDITDLAKELLIQETPDDAKTTLEVTEGGGGTGGAIVPFTF